jgi:hypothetical protein
MEIIFFSVYIIEVFMKKMILFLCIILFCCRKENKYYDVEGPELIFSNQIGDRVLLQFDEPVKELDCSLDSEENKSSFSRKNSFPLANNYFDISFFKNRGILTVTALDTANNKKTMEIKSPEINQDPCIIEIIEVQLKYTKKKPQFILLKALKGGNTSGFSLCYYVNSDKYQYDFTGEIIKKGDWVKLIINPDKKLYTEKNDIIFSKKIIKITAKTSISPTSALICIKDFNSLIKDYLLYYDSKSHPLEYYLSKKSYKSLISYLKNFNIEPDSFDIKGNTTKKHIYKVGKKYTVY